MRIRLGLPNTRSQFPFSPDVGNCPEIHDALPITIMLFGMDCHKKVRNRLENTVIKAMSTV
jgi:hypothetical protein